MIKKVYNNIILPACGIYTLISLFFALTSFTLDKSIPAIAMSNLLIMAGYSLLLSILNLILRIKALNVYIRIPLHYIASTLSLYLILLVAAGDIVSNTQNIRLVLVLFYSIIYIIATVIFICINETRKKPKKVKSENYDNIYN